MDQQEVVVDEAIVVELLREVEEELAAMAFGSSSSSGGGGPSTVEIVVDTIYFTNNSSSSSSGPIDRVVIEVEEDEIVLSLPGTNTEQEEQEELLAPVAKDDDEHPPASAALRTENRLPSNANDQGPATIQADAFQQWQPDSFSNPGWRPRPVLVQGNDDPVDSLVSMLPVAAACVLFFVFTSWSHLRRTRRRVILERHENDDHWVTEMDLREATHGYGHRY